MDTNSTGLGALTARVSAGRGTLPIEGATVYIRPYTEESGGGDVIYTLRTDRNGLTPTVSLAAPPKLASLSPDSEALPYSEYIMTVTKEGYNSVENIGIPIFDGISSIQSVNLVPLTDFQRLSGDDGTLKFYENGGYTNLRGTDGDRTDVEGEVTP